MTTAVKVHVNGRYRATVEQTTADGTKLDPIVVEGNYEGSSNPSGEHIFWLQQTASSTFKVTEEYLGQG